MVLFTGCSDTSNTYVTIASSDPAPTGTISGTVYVPGGQQGRIYVLAIDTSDQHAIRVMETLDKPYLSQNVSGYDQLSTAGMYSISGLPEGEYTLFAWVDIDGDGGINHLNYAEPTGWYQTREHLLPLLVHVTSEEIVEDIDFSIVSPTPYASRDLVVSTGLGGGSLTTVKGFDPPQSSYTAGAKLTVMTNYAVTLSLNYDFEIKDNFHSHTGYVDVRYAF